MEKSIFVHVSESTKNLMNVGSKFDTSILDFRFSKAFTLLLHVRVHFIQVVVQILENHIEFFGDEEDFLEFNYILVV